MKLDTEKVFLLLGSNLGDRKANLKNAVRLIGQRLGCITRRSAIYETAAWGNTQQPGFLNMAVELDTDLQPLALLQAVLLIEKDLGRIREVKWGPRLIDIDIILYGDRIINVPDVLQVPHPEMQNRRFVMKPLVELAPQLLHPRLELTMAEILLKLSDELAVERIGRLRNEAGQRKLKR